MKRFIPQLLRGRIRRIALLGAASMLVALNAQAADQAVIVGVEDGEG